MTVISYIDCSRTAHWVKSIVFDANEIHIINDTKTDAIRKATNMVECLIAKEFQKDDKKSSYFRFPVLLLEENIRNMLITDYGDQLIHEIPLLDKATFDILTLLRKMNIKSLSLRKTPRRLEQLINMKGRSRIMSLLFMHRFMCRSAKRRGRSRRHYTCGIQGRSNAIIHYLARRYDQPLFL